MATRRKIVTARIAEDNSAIEFDIHGPLDAATGKFPVVDGLTFNAASLPASREVWFALYGLSQIVANRYNRLDDDATPADVRAAVAEILDAVRADTWQPGRSFTERDPTDLELAIAEALGRDIREVMDDIENKVQTNEDGTPKLDKRGRQMRVFTQRMLDAIAADAKVKPILARLTAERAKRLQAEAKAGGGTDMLSSMFGTSEAEPEQAAAQ